jgi:nitrile hydratase
MPHDHGHPQDKHKHGHEQGRGVIGFLRWLFGSGHQHDHGHKHDTHGHNHEHHEHDHKAHEHGHDHRDHKNDHLEKDHGHNHDDHGHGHDHPHPHPHDAHDHGHDHPHPHPHDAHDHGHDHPHPHVHTASEFQPDEKIHGYYQLLGLALKELLIEKNIVTSEEIRKGIEARDAITPSFGAKVVAKAWADTAFKARLLHDAGAACRELGIDIGPTNLVAVENTDTVHNVIVCTLCSCYPRAVLGLPPSWYKSRDYRARIVREPRTVLKEFGTTIPEYMHLRVHDSTADLRYLVLPARPTGTESMSEEALAALVNRDSMIGVTLADAPVKN